ncbi:hypothetical protein HF313_18400 [Massilia atriviolacea]|uniref:Uncharacterized protein n=1 Tax=Massilia atriviolacea TaxID=2495579 RepID=A0A430HT84_9BURK|nr:hypothetical protein [Massilia atriviolacea]RSZ60745.1 hypothetical protein EJB06_00985 [Massilia atriviolacea]
MDNDDAGIGRIRIAPGYATLQLAAALRAVGDHPDPQVRARAAVKAQRWEQLMAGMFTGAIEVGSRTPLSGVPAWVTPDVAKGGFATGDFKAGGPLLEHELRTLATAGIAPAPDARSWLNARLLSEEGLASLYALLDAGCYEIDAPEEGALLVVAWLTRHGKPEQAREVLDAIAPWFARLRFYPRPAAQPRRYGEQVFLAPVREVVAALQKRARATNLRILAQRAAVRVRLPLYDRVVQLFLDSVDGEAPFIDIGDDGAWRDSASGKFRIAGGWPCRCYPADWRRRAQALLHEPEARAASARKGDCLAELLGYLHLCVTEPALLIGRDVGRIRLILGRYVSKRGLPGSAQLAALRSEQARQVEATPYHLLAGVLAERLGASAQDGGLEDPAKFGAPLSAAEADSLGEAAGTPIPAVLLDKLDRCGIETVSVLVERGVIASAEVLAEVLPQLSAAINGAALAEPSLKQLYGALYHAFRRRRSLLLQNLESQVRIGELPWVAAVNAQRQQGLAPRALARRTLDELALLALTSFPQTAIPNPLINELGTLAGNAGLDLPLAEELAADIFMGVFAHKFTLVAAHATSMLDDSLYSRYYGIDAAVREQLRELARERVAKDGAQPGVRSLTALCEARAGVRCGYGSVRDNAMIIEQQQILTTHNLAALVARLDLDGELRPHYERMAQQCFAWMCANQQNALDTWPGNLRAIRHAAYAWRQMMFFLSMTPAASQAQFIAWDQAHLAQASPRLQQRLAPALAGLALAAAGHSLDERASLSGGARRLLAYAKGEHWMALA